MADITAVTTDRLDGLTLHLRTSTSFGSVVMILGLCTLKLLFIVIVKVLWMH